MIVFDHVYKLLSVYSVLALKHCNNLLPIDTFDKLELIVYLSNTVTDVLTLHTRYYAALKTMEQLENIYIPRVSQYRFCQIMAETLPKLREEIKEISMSDLKDFLESIRKHSDKIGETAMRQVRICHVFISAFFF